MPISKIRRFLNFEVKIKDTNRKITKTEFIRIHLWFQKLFQQQHCKHKWSLRQCEQKVLCSVHALRLLFGIWNQNSKTVINEKCCSYLSITIFNQNMDRLLSTLITKRVCYLVTLKYVFSKLICLLPRGVAANENAQNFARF